MAATIKDLARETGLGYATISAYLNDVRVRPDNRIKIENAIKKLGYIRNEYARGLKTRQSKTIGVLIPELANAFSTMFVSEMEDVLRRNGYGIIVCDCRSDMDLETEAVRFLLSKMVDGLVIMPIMARCEAIDLAIANDVPVVAVDRMTDSPDAAHIVINNAEISDKAVTEMITAGNRNIAMLAGGEEVYTARERRRGYIEALERAGLYKPELVFDCGLSVQGAYAKVRQVISDYPYIDAFFVANYEMTLGALMAINEENKRIPEDFSFVGFDNPELSKVYATELATVIQPLKEIGYTAAVTMLNRIEGKPTKNITLNAQLISGKSIAVRK